MKNGPTLANVFYVCGGPLRGTQKEVAEEDLRDGKFMYLEWSEYKDAFSLLPPLTIHHYLPVADEMLWVEPDKIKE
jgi:hypothetical protein